MLINFLPPAAAYACSYPPEPFFAPPTYIDIDYQAPSEADVNYGPQSEFALLLEHYKYSEKTDDGTAAAMEANARASSQAQEPEDYAKYLRGAERFVAGDYENAQQIFVELHHRSVSFKEKLRRWLGKPSQSWVREASTYMMARCQLIIAQKDWDGFSSPASGVQQATLKSAADLYQAYLLDYPQGLYAESARNLRRKIDYLSGNQADLDRELRRAMTEAFTAAQNPVQRRGQSVTMSEFETYFHGQIDIAQDSPMLIAFAWLGEQKPKPSEMATLLTREKDFAVYPGLFRFVRALGLYQLGQYAELIQKTPEQPVTQDVVSLSTELLRANAFTRLDKIEAALAAYTKMQAASPQQAIELHIVELKLRRTALLWLYSKDSPVKTEKVLRSVAQFAFSDDQLQSGIKDPQITAANHQILVDELARRYVLTLRFKTLAILLADNPTGPFAPLKRPVAKLVNDPQDLQAFADAGEFLYQHSVSATGLLSSEGSPQETSEALPELLPYCAACAKFKERTKDYKPPIFFFHTVAVAAQNAGQTSEAEAKALHYLVSCERQGYASEGRCKWEYSQPQKSTGASRAAFIRLHRLYKNSKWAAATPYYY